jgi:hypothetical protein
LEIAQLLNDADQYQEQEQRHQENIIKAVHDNFASDQFERKRFGPRTNEKGFWTIEDRVIWVGRLPPQ